MRKYENHLSEIISIKLLALVLMGFAFFVPIGILLKDNLWGRIGVVAVVLLLMGLNVKNIAAFFKKMRAS